MIPQGYQTGRAGHEPKDADVIGLGVIIAMLLLIIGICLLVSFGTLHFFQRKDGARRESPGAAMAAQVAAFPQPRLLIRPGSERKDLEKTQRTQLDTYGWVDRQAGVARIPIARAMQLLVERGLPEVGAGQSRLQLMQSRPQTDVQPNEPVSSPGPEVTP